MAYTFPDTSNAPKGQNGDEIIGASIALNRPLLHIREMAFQRNIVPWDLYVISVYTIARNVHEEASSAIELARLIDRDVEYLMSYLEAFHVQKKEQGASLPRIVFYLPIYDRLPKHLRREHTGKAAELDDWYLKYLSRFPKGPTDITQTPLSQCFTTIVGTTLLPHRELAQEIKEHKFNQAGYGSPRILLLSHCLLDYYLVKQFHVEVIESYTGQIKGPETFSHRLNKDGLVPFNRIFHRLLGDSTWVLPLATGKIKTKILEMAKERKWNQKTEHEILKDLVVNYNIEQSALTDLKI